MVAPSSFDMVDYATGAKRSSNDGRPNYSGYVSAWVTKFFGRYMLKHQTCADGSKREAHNWKYGQPLGRYMESLSRHYTELSELWDRITLYEGQTPENVRDFEEALGGVLFNINGMIHEYERAREAGITQAALSAPPSSDELPRLLRNIEGQSKQSSRELQSPEASSSPIREERPPTQGQDPL